HAVRALRRARRDAGGRAAADRAQSAADPHPHPEPDAPQPGRARLAHRRAALGAPPRAARHPDELRQPARRALHEPALRALHLHRLLQPALGEPGARGAGAARLQRRLVDRARRDGAAPARPLRAAHAPRAPAPGAMSTLHRYFARQVYGAVLFVLVGFLALFAFFDVVNELKDLGRGNYGLREVFLYVLLSLPTHAYELFPIVVLIGTLYVLSHLASNSEYTVMRASGLSPARTA